LAKERAEEKAPFRALCHYIEMDLFGCKECEKVAIVCLKWLRIIKILIKMQQLNAPVSKMDLAELLYQDVVLSNGFRSIDNTLYRICVQLALNPAVQTKLRAEIEMTNEKGRIILYYFV
jgi:hypothetical protein